MSAKDRQEGWGLSSEHDEDQVLEVDSRSADVEELREHAKAPKAPWSAEQQAEPKAEQAPEQDPERDKDEG